METVIVMNDLLKELNAEQRKAAMILEGPALVIAGAGSGKTKVVTCRIVQLIESGVDPLSILGLTFTKKASGEMRERISKLSRHDVLISTFHSLGALILRESIHLLGYQRNFIIYDAEDSDKLIKTCLIELNLTDKKFEARAFKNLISKAKNALEMPEESGLSRDTHTDIESAFPRVYALYQSRLKQYNALDFDDLLFLTVRLWKEHPLALERYQKRWPFVLIDEYQDTNEVQYTMIRLLVAKSNNIFVVGDPDQSIYSWRGANIRNILNFERDYPGARVICLEQNYRSSTNILNAANALISHNTDRYEKKLWSDKGSGEKIKLFVGEDEKTEANFVAKQVRFHRDEQFTSLNEMVVFYRTNAQSRAFEDYLSYQSIPYVIVGGVSFYQRREVKDILAFLRVAHAGSDFIAFTRTINLPKRGIGDATIEKMRIGANEERLTILAYCEALVTDQTLKKTFRLSAKQKESIMEYIRIIHELHVVAKENSIKELVLAAIERTHYLAYLKEDKETYEDRKANLDELIAKAVEWETFAEDPSLESFLEELSLKSTLDEVKESEERLSLMTIHNGKGLEFKVAFLVGLEEDLFPHANSRNSMDELEEERRLCYVGMTRAKEYLYLSYCYTRYLWGTLRMQRPSRFFKEIPEIYLENFKSASASALKSGSFQPIRREKQVVVPLVQPVAIPSSEVFAGGETIFHKEFGIGQIKEAYEGSLGLTYKIFFTKDNSVKTLVAKYASLTRL